MGPQLFCFSDGVNLLEFIKFVFLLLCNVFFFNLFRRSCWNELVLMH